MKMSMKSKLFMKLHNINWVYTAKDGTMRKELPPGNSFTGTYHQWRMPDDYYCTSALITIEQFKSGYLHGLQRDWYQNGEIKTEEGFHMGKRHGQLLSWYPNRKLNRIENFKHGKRNGHHIYYDKNGTINSELTFKNGERIWIDQGAQ